MSVKNPFKLIGLTGYAQHGKDSVAKTLIEQAGFHRLAFADGVREVALAINPIITWGIDHSREETLLDKILKNCSWFTSQYVPTTTVREVRLADVVGEFGWDRAKQHPEIRKLLQRVGTEAGRDILGPNVWVDRVANMCRSYDCVVITDVRFPNEAEWLAAAGGELWRVDRPGFENGVSKDHPSEAFIPKLRATRVLINDGTLRQLRDNVLVHLGLG